MARPTITNAIRRNRERQNLAAAPHRLGEFSAERGAAGALRSGEHAARNDVLIDGPSRIEALADSLVATAILLIEEMRAQSNAELADEKRAAVLDKLVDFLETEIGADPTAFDDVLDRDNDGVIDTRRDGPSVGNARRTVETRSQRRARERGEA